MRAAGSGERAGPADPSAGSASPAGARSVAAWDLPTRLFKWTLVTLVLLSWATQAAGDRWLGLHIQLGHAVLILLVFRLLWGLVGSSTARFASWVAWPWNAVSYGAQLVRGRGRPYLGHNPLGGWMIILLLAFVAAQGVTGLFTADNNGLSGGPFANLDFGDPTPIQRAFGAWHHLAFNLLLGLIAIHVFTNLFYEAAKGDPVISAMVTGRKPAEPFADEPEMVAPPRLWLRAGLCLVAAAALVLGTVKAFGGKLPF